MYFARRISVDELLQRIRDREHIPARTSLDLVRRLLDPGPKSSDLHISELNVHFQDPVLRKRIVMPVRATTCDHPLCFDAESYLQMEDRNPKWLCPVCGKPIRFENIRVDMLFVDLLARFPDAENFRFTAETLLQEEGTLLQRTYAQRVREQRLKQNQNKNQNQMPLLSSSSTVKRHSVASAVDRLPSLQAIRQQQVKAQSNANANALAAAASASISGSESDDSVTAPTATAERRRRIVQKTGKSRILNRIVGNNSTLRNQLHVTSQIQSRLQQPQLQQQQLQPHLQQQIAGPAPIWPNAHIPLSHLHTHAQTAPFGRGSPIAVTPIFPLTSMASASASPSPSPGSRCSPFAQSPSANLLKPNGASAAISQNGIIAFAGNGSTFGSDAGILVHTVEPLQSQPHDQGGSLEGSPAAAASASASAQAVSLERRDSVINISSDED